MIPTYLEQLIHQGKATYDSRSYGVAQNWQLEVNDTEYIVIFGFYYTPYINAAFQSNDDEGFYKYDNQDSVQCVQFFTGNNFHPFIFKQTPSVQSVSVNNEGIANRIIPNRTAEFRSCYIISDQNVNVAITRQTSGQTNLIDINPTPQFGTNIAGFGYAGSESIFEMESLNGNALSTIPYGQQATNNYFPPLLSPQAYNQVFFTTPNGAVPTDNLMLVDDQVYKLAASYFLTINFCRIKGNLPGKAIL